MIHFVGQTSLETYTDICNRIELEDNEQVIIQLGNLNANGEKFKIGPNNYLLAGKDDNYQRLSLYENFIGSPEVKTLFDKRVFFLPYMEDHSYKEINDAIELCEHTNPDILVSYTAPSESYGLVTKSPKTHQAIKEMLQMSTINLVVFSEELPKLFGVTTSHDIKFVPIRKGEYFTLTNE